jgi:hypothetical protein
MHVNCIEEQQIRAMAGALAIFSEVLLGFFGPLQGMLG